MYDVLRWLNVKKEEAIRSKISNHKKNAIALGVEIVDTGFCWLAAYGLGTIIGKIINFIRKK